MGLLIAASLFLLIVIGGLSSLAVSSFNSGKKSGREDKLEAEKDYAKAEANAAQKIAEAEAHAPKTPAELQNRLEEGSF